MPPARRWNFSSSSSPAGCLTEDKGIADVHSVSLFSALFHNIYMCFFFFLRPVPLGPAYLELEWKFSKLRTKQRMILHCVNILLEWVFFLSFISQIAHQVVISTGSSCRREGYFDKKNALQGKKTSACMDLWSSLQISTVALVFKKIPWGKQPHEWDSPICLDPPVRLSCLQTASPSQNQPLHVSLKRLPWMFTHLASIQRFFSAAYFFSRLPFTISWPPYLYCKGTAGLYGHAQLW